MADAAAINNRRRKSESGWRARPGRLWGTVLAGLRPAGAPSSSTLSKSRSRDSRSLLLIESTDDRTRSSSILDRIVSKLRLSVLNRLTCTEIRTNNG